MRSFFNLLLLLGMAWSSLSAQSTAFGIKGGLTIGVQQWNGFQQDPLFKYNGILFVESAPEGNEFAVFAQAGYHIKGSAIRNRNVRDRFDDTKVYRLPAQDFQFRNISLVLGGKQKYDFSAAAKAYYLIGIRGDYTVSTNLKEYEAINLLYNSLYFPIDGFVNKWNYGVTVGGGLEFPFAELVGGIIELTVNPDFSRQYRQPEIPNVYDPFTGGSRTIPERLIRNITFEVTVGLRLIHKVVYVD